ncbi:MAG: DUF503 domain-containing protein [Candidatus Aminicenantales bacterium]
MIIGLLVLEIHIPYARSLKEKRKTLNSLRDRVRKRWNVALSEVDYLQKWQRSRIAIVSVNTRKSPLERAFQAILQDIENSIDGEVTFLETSFF